MRVWLERRSQFERSSIEYFYLRFLLLLVERAAFGRNLHDNTFIISITFNNSQSVNGPVHAMRFLDKSVLFTENSGGDDGVLSC